MSMRSRWGSLVVLFSLAGLAVLEGEARAQGTARSVDHRSVVVVDDASRPVVGALVRVYGDGPALELEVEPASRRELDELLFEGRSDAQGRVRMPGIRRHGHWIEVESGPLRGEGRLLKGDTTWIRLVPQRDLIVDVVDERGAPLAGVPLSLHRANGSDVRRATRTDERGVALLLDVGGYVGVDDWSVGVLGPAAASSRVRLTPEAVADGLRLTLARPTELVIEVEDRDGRALRDELRARLLPAGKRRFATDCLRAAADDGVLHFPWLPLDVDLELVLERGDYVEGMEVPLRLRDEEVGRARRTLRWVDAGPVLRVRVVDEEGEPRRGLDCQARFHYPESQLGMGCGGLLSGEHWRLLRTDELGRIELGLDDAYFPHASIENPTFGGTLEVSLPWPEDARRTPDSFVREFELPARAGLQDLGDVVLRRPPVLLAGRVLDADGVPLEGCSLLPGESWESQGFVSRRGANGTFESVEVSFTEHYSLSHPTLTTDADGRFELRAWSEGQPLRLQVRHRSRERPLVVEGLPSGASDLELRFPRIGTLSGRILPVRGLPEGVRVHVALRGELPPQDPLAPLLGPAAAAGYSAPVEVPGVLRFDEVVPGRYFLVLTHVDGLRLELGPYAVDAGENAPLELQSLDLTPHVFPLAVEVKGGAPVPGQLRRTRLRFVRPDGPGRFLAEGETTWLLPVEAAPRFELLDLQRPGLGVEPVWTSGDVRAPGRVRFDLDRILEEVARRGGE